MCYCEWLRKCKSFLSVKTSRTPAVSAKHHINNTYAFILACFKGGQELIEALYFQYVPNGLQLESL